ncbi:hypothetical protein DKX38_012013 [Salix brachista]|uniref:Uncharacterized protein n=1 Tax=Salix brachista TaxID=2182728 RepID=A0A5N5LP64_9ROSI|nr:hypothetical protein DKX38_012013 [Salix brachista]
MIFYKLTSLDRDLLLIWEPLEESCRKAFWKLILSFSFHRSSFVFTYYHLWDDWSQGLQLLMLHYAYSVFACLLRTHNQAMPASLDFLGEVTVFLQIQMFYELTLIALSVHKFSVPFHVISRTERSKTSEIKNV